MSARERVAALMEHHSPRGPRDEDGDQECRCGIWIGSSFKRHQPERGDFHRHRAEVLWDADLIGECSVVHDRGSAGNQW